MYGFIMPLIKRGCAGSNYHDNLSSALLGFDDTDFTIFNRYDWTSILVVQPKFADRCDFDEFTYGMIPKYEWLKLTDKDDMRMRQYTVSKTLNIRII